MTQQQNQLVPIQMGGHLLGRMTSDGKHIEAVRGKVALSEKQGEFVMIQEKAMTTAKGFQKLNTIAGVSIITPSTLTAPIDGEVREVPNPFPIIDPASKTISKVWVRKTAIGFSPIGNLVITQASLLYDIRMYFIQDLMKTVQYKADAGRICTLDMLDPEERKHMRFEAFEGDLGIAVFLNNKDILKNINTFINKKQFAERNAQTIAERLVMSKHPALAFPYIDEYVQPGPEKQRFANVELWGWRHGLTRQQMEQVAQQAERGEEIQLDGIKVVKQEVFVSEQELVEFANQEQESDEYSSPDLSEELEKGLTF
ncbi:hypothetical protein JJB07_14630 [Tumebacillus sp. ITR2]|uniref:Uncharacterized protein n=1 Tax=Tumebacillus amylolyticus TaxID=2801339 RepID=A0ABS1JCW1_9BACL|nr:hypothetical protein [Tumebacillus amylolyticus]MBL0387874.1 hypothetical protein [Tumebacillus amylolyticus]